jgi:fructose-1,6-bisphosphatase/inositol monophosphatase family enzyme
VPTLTDTELDTALDVALEAADRAVAIARTTPVGTVETKKHAADHVTEVDRATERMVRTLVEHRLPGHTVVGEEYGGTAGDGPTWFCDPVDGTTNLSAGLPWTSFSLALAVGSDPLVAVVADPWRAEVLQAVAGRGCRIGDRVSQPGDVDTLTGGVVLTEWAGYRPWPGMLALLDRLSGLLCTTRIMGSSTLTLAHPAAGRSLGAVVGEFHPEDHLAAALLCSEAGLAVLDDDGQRNLFPAGGGMLVARRGVAHELFGLWHDAVRDAELR